MTETLSPAVAVAIDTPRTRLIADLRSSVLYAQGQMDKFVETFQQNPLYALEWAGTQVKLAAELELNAFVLNALTREEGEPVTLAAIKKHTHDIAWRCARYPAHSSSGLSNLIEQAKGEAAAKFYESLEYKQDEAFDVQVPPPAPRPVVAPVAEPARKRSRR